MITPIITAFIGGGSTATGLLLLIAGHIPQGGASVVFGVLCTLRAFIEQKHRAPF